MRGALSIRVIMQFRILCREFNEDLIRDTNIDEPSNPCKPKVDAGFPRLGQFFQGLSAQYQATLLLTRSRPTAVNLEAFNISGSM